MTERKATFNLVPVTGTPFNEQIADLQENALETLPVVTSAIIDINNLDTTIRSLKGMEFGTNNFPNKWRVYFDGSTLIAQENTGTTGSPVWTTKGNLSQLGINIPKYYEKTSNQIITVNTETVITGISNVAIPNSDGIKNFALYLNIGYKVNVGALVFRVYVGTTGSTSDPLIHIYEDAIDESINLLGSSCVGPILLKVPPLNSKVTITAQFTSASATHSIYGGGQRSTVIEIKEIILP